MERNKLFEGYHATIAAINSCERLEQLENAEHMIQNFGHNFINIASITLFMTDLKFVLEKKRAELEPIILTDNTQENDNGTSNEGSTGTGANEEKL